MNQWELDDTIIFRLETDQPDEWRSAGTLADLYMQHRQQVIEADRQLIAAYASEQLALERVG